jgi:peptidoglycan hydrolase-like protein with peptidoglycan-binding domain
LVLAVGGTAFGVAKVLNRHSGGTPNPQALSSAAPTVVPTYDAASAATPAAGVSCNLSGPSTSAYPNRILRRGMGSADSPDVDVIRVQHWLKLRGATTSCVDGIFGVQTEQLVSLFQRDNNLTISGVVDQQTWNVLFGLSPAPAAADACVAGYVWRLARPTDHVCVTESTREQVIADNTEGPSRVDPNGQAGPNTCIIPYVWRKAFPGDMVCVAPPVHDQAQHDNAEAPFRVRHRG